MSGQVIFIDDESAIRQAVQQWLELSGFRVRTCASAREALGLIDRDTVVVFNKTDLATAGDLRPDLSPILVSAHTGSGLKELEEKLTAYSADRLAIGSAPSLTRARHRAALTECRESLLRALHAPLPELAAEDVRLASRALGRITGRVDVEDLLDVIFRDFCIGK